MTGVVTAVTANNRRRVFEVRLSRKGDFVFPFAVCEPEPTTENRIVEVFVDDEVAREGFTYVLASGAEGTVLADHVLHYNADPGYVAEQVLYELSHEASRRWSRTGLSAREVARRLGTSPAQVYRLLDPTRRDKSLGQMLALLHVLGATVDVSVRDRPDSAA